MNILLNNYCNLNCEYCFANKVLEEDREKMSLTDFKFVLGFLKRSNTKSVRLIGGEPTLHPEFTSIVNAVCQDDFFEEVFIFTNGLFNENVKSTIEMSSKIKQTSLLINLNEKEVIGEKNYNLIEKNINDLLKTNKRITITLGINFYKKNQDYSHIIQMAKKYNIKSIRWSLVVPNTTEKENMDIKQYYLEHRDNIYNFINDCSIKGIGTHVDCNNIPLCLIEDDILKNLCLVAPRNTTVSVCHPVIDIKPDLSAIRCFAFSDDCVDLKMFNNAHEIFEYFDKKDDIFNGVKIFSHCCDCKSFKQKNRSCGCLAFQKGVI